MNKPKRVDTKVTRARSIRNIVLRVGGVMLLAIGALMVLHTILLAQSETPRQLVYPVSIEGTEYTEVQRATVEHILTQRAEARSNDLALTATEFVVDATRGAQPQATQTAQELGSQPITTTPEATSD